MLTIEVWLDSAFDGTRRLVARGEIINDRSGTTAEGNYDAEFVVWPPRRRPVGVHRGRVLGHDRGENVLRLLVAAIEAALGARSKP